jgi:hypothetical protein
MRKLDIYELEAIEGRGFWKWFKCGTGIALVIVGIFGLGAAGTGGPAIKGGVVLMGTNYVDATADVEANGSNGIPVIIR